MPTLDIVVVGYRPGEDLACLRRDLPVMTRTPHKLYYFDNTGNPITLSMAWNNLGNLGSGDYIAFLNTDIRLSPGWDTPLTERLKTDEKAGATLPFPVGHGWPTLVDSTKPPFPSSRTAPAPTPEAMAKIAQDNRDNKSRYGFGECNAAFFAVMVSRKGWEGLKGFDERFRLYGQDHDYQRRLKNCLGKVAMRISKSQVWHRCAGCILPAQGEINLNAEMKHTGQVGRAIMSGRDKFWHRLSDAERKAVRENSRFNSMPTR